MEEGTGGAIPVLPPTLAGVFLDALAFAGAQLTWLVERDIRFQGSHAVYARLETMLGKSDTGYDNMVTAAYIAFSGGIDGHVLLCMTPEASNSLACSLLMCDDITTPQMHYLADSMIGEIANVAASAFLSAVADFAQLRVLPSPPSVVHDMLGAVLQSLVVEVAQTQMWGIFIETEIVVEGDALGGTLVLLPSLDSCSRLEQIAASRPPPLDSATGD